MHEMNWIDETPLGVWLSWKTILLNESDRGKVCPVILVEWQQRKSITLYIELYRVVIIRIKRFIEDVVLSLVELASIYLFIHLFIITQSCFMWSFAIFVELMAILWLIAFSEFDCVTICPSSISEKLATSQSILIRSDNSSHTLVSQKLSFWTSDSSSITYCEYNFQYEILLYHPTSQ